jgi:hypothetical protein
MAPFGRVREWIRTTFSASQPDSPAQLLSVWAEKLNLGRTTVSREEALSVPAVLKGRNQIAAIGTLPLETVTAGNRVVAGRLTDQIDPNVPDVVTKTQLVEDLLFEAVAWLLVTERDEDDYPVRATRVEPGNVSSTPPHNSKRTDPLPSGIDPHSVMYVEGLPVSKRNLKRFDSPNPALLTYAGRAIHTAIRLSEAGVTYAENPRPQDFFTPAPGDADPDQDTIDETLSGWRKARRKSSTAFVPSRLVYNTVDSIAPVQLQLVELLRQATLDIANGLGLDPEDLGISTTSRTYQNATDRRQDRINETLAPYMTAITDRLSMDDITRPGELVRFKLDNYLKADPKTRAEIDDIRLRNGSTTLDEIREREGQPPLPPRPAPIPATVGSPIEQARRVIEAA